MSDSDKTRRHLVHVLPELEVSGCYALILTLASELKDYSHTLLTECDLSVVDPDMLGAMQTAGVDVKIVEQVSDEHLDEDYTGAILYNVRDRLIGAKLPIPTIYYSYGINDTRVPRDLTAVCSEFASVHPRKGIYTEFPHHVIIPPMVQTRSLRRIKAPEHSFAVSILTSGAYDKYPCNFVREMLYKLPEDMRVMMSTLPKYKHPGMRMAIDDRSARCRGKLLACRIRPQAALYYMIQTDIVIYASAEDHNEPYGRLVVEAMALGKPVICENRGVFKTTLKHGVEALLFDTADQAIEHVETIRKNKAIAVQLGSNAQMWASWQDATVHIGKLKRALRSIGA